MRLLVPAYAFLATISMVVTAGSARAEESTAEAEAAITASYAATPMRTRHGYTVDANLPTPEQIGPSLDPRTIPLVHDALGLVVERKMWIAPRLVEMTLVSGTKLVTLDLLGRASLSLEPTGFNSGVVTLAAHF